MIGRGLKEDAPSVADVNQNCHACGCIALLSIPPSHLPIYMHRGELPSTATNTRRAAATEVRESTATVSDHTTPLLSVVPVQILENVVMIAEGGAHCG